MGIKSIHILSVIAVLLAVVSLAPAANAATITVPGQCLTIEDAITAASAGDTIIVDSGTYKENVVINKSIALIGVDTGAGQPVVDGGILYGIGSIIFSIGIDIKADHVMVQGFNVTSSHTGIEIEGSNNCNLTRNTVNSNNYGIYIDGSSNNNTVAGNTVNNNWGSIISNIYYYYYGLYVGGSGNTVTGNTVNNNDKGIVIGGSGNYGPETRQTATDGVSG